MKNKVLILDDDPYLISEVMTYLDSHFQVEGFTDVEHAKNYLDSPEGTEVVFAIVDLFLQGDRGDELSNNFVRDILIKKRIPFCRLTSAPKLVPPDLGGLAIFDKRKLYEDDFDLLSLILSCL